MTGRVSSSFRQGIWMISFIGARLDGIGSSSCLRSWKARPFPGGRRSRASASLDADALARIAFGAALRRRRGRVLRLSHVPQLRLVLLAAVGPRGARPAAPGLRGLPRADRAPAGDRRRRAAVAARPPRRPHVHRADPRVVPVADLGRLPARPDRVHAARRRRRRGCSRSRASTSASSPPAATSTSRTWRWSCGRRRSRPAGRGAACRCSCSLALAGLLRPEAWVLAGLYWLWLAWRATWRQRVLLRGAGRDRPGGVDADRPDRHRRPAVLAALHEHARRRTSAASARSSELPDGDPGVLHVDRQAAGAGGGAARPRDRAGVRARAARRCRWRCCVSGIVHVRADRRSPARR